MTRISLSDQLRALAENPFEESTGYWWLFITIVSILNIILTIIFMIYWRNVKKTRLTKLVWIFGSIYVVVCAWRSFFPGIGLSRLCFFDTDFATPIVDRSLATISEMCFISVLAILYNRIWRDLVAPITGITETITLILIWAMIPAIGTAQIFCWIGVATTNSLFNAIEVSIWTTVLSFLMILSFTTIIFFTPSERDVYRIVLFTGVACLGFVLFEVIVDIPYYINSYNDGPKIFVTFAEGAEEMKECLVISKLLSDWGSNIPWQTGYFTTGVWWMMVLVQFNQFMEYTNRIKAASKDVEPEKAISLSV